MSKKFIELFNDKEKENMSEEATIKTGRYNKSVYFLLPMLGLQTGYYATLINCYIRDEVKPEYRDFYLFLLMRYKEDKLKAIEGYTTEYQTDDGIMYVYRIPEHFEGDYIKFIYGEYSNFSVKYKDQIIRLLPKPYQDNTVYKVITKDPSRRKWIEERIGMSIGSAEVMSIPDITEETYRR